MASGIMDHAVASDLFCLRYVQYVRYTYTEMRVVHCTIRTTEDLSYVRDAYYCTGAVRRLWYLLYVLLCFPIRASNDSSHSVVLRWLFMSTTVTVNTIL